MQCLSSIEMSATSSVFFLQQAVLSGSHFSVSCGTILKRPQLTSPQSSSTCMVYEKTQTVGVS